MLDKLKGKKVSPAVLAVIILLLILICSFILFFEINDYSSVKSETHQFYYYFTTNRIDFEGNVTVNVNETILSIQNDSVALDSTPIYYNDYDGLLVMPNNMEIVFPYRKNPMYKVGKFSKLYSKKNYLYINSEAGIGRLYDCFFYDGKDLYVFIENTTVVINEQKYELSPMSFIEVTNNYIKMYNYKTEEYIFLDSYTGKVEAYTEEYVINLYNDTFTYGTSFYMLIKNIDGLEFIEF